MRTYGTQRGADEDPSPLCHRQPEQLEGPFGQGSQEEFEGVHGVMNELVQILTWVWPMLATALVMLLFIASIELIFHILTDKK